MVLARGFASLLCSMRLPRNLVILSMAKDLAVVLAWRVNDGSCAGLGKVPLFRAAAAARVTFLLGKVTKAVHATA
ncbi:hypothetical protein, partial [Metallibacterium scheffleri]